MAVSATPADSPAPTLRQLLYLNRQTFEDAFGTRNPRVPLPEIIERYMAQPTSKHTVATQQYNRVDPCLGIFRFDKPSVTPMFQYVMKHWKVCGDNCASLRHVLEYLEWRKPPGNFPSLRVNMSSKGSNRQIESRDMPADIAMWDMTHKRNIVNTSRSFPPEFNILACATHDVEPHVRKLWRNGSNGLHAFPWIQMSDVSNNKAGTLPNSLKLPGCRRIRRNNDGFSIEFWKF